MRPVTILFKPVSSSCTLDCTYCFYKSKRANKKIIISTDIVKSLISSLGKFKPHTKINFIWHGGEPLLSGIDFFKDTIVNLKAITTQFGIEVKNSIQTSGTLLNDNWCKLLKEYNFSIGLSLDGPENIHNINRKYANGIGSYGAVLRGISLLKKYNFDFGVLSTVTKASLGKEAYIFEFFVKNEIMRFDFLPCFYTGDNRHSCITVTPQEYTKFLQTIFDIWYEYDDPIIEIRFLKEIIKGFLGGSPSLCSLSDKCEQFFTVEHDGNIYPCDDFSNDDRYLYGNILSDGAKPFEEVNPFNERFKEIKDRVYKRMGCKTCEYLLICGGGCRRYERICMEICQSRKELFSYIKRNLSDTLQYIELKIKET